MTKKKTDLNRIPLWRLKSGRDKFSRLKLEQLEKLVSVDDLSLAQREFANVKLLASCLRWRLRGLQINKAIRKVIRDEEAKKSHRKRSRERAW